MSYLLSRWLVDPPGVARHAHDPVTGLDDDLPRRSFAALCVGMPLALFALHHGHGHQGDMRFFYDWMRAFEHGVGFYGDGPGLNYPIVGVLLVSVPFLLVEAIARSVGALALGPAEYVLVLKSTLVLGEMLLAPVAAGLAGAVGVSRPRRFAIALYLVPSTWGGGAWFGQIDVFGTVLLLAAAWGLVLYARSGHRRDLVLGLLALHTAVLAKQLVLFSVPGLLLLLSVGLWRRRAGLDLGLALVSPALWFVADPLLTLPPGYGSHLAFVLAGGGSSHMDVLVGGGASLWSLLSDNPQADAHVFGYFGVTAYVWGLALFTTANLITGAWLLWVRRLSPPAILFFIGMANLTMAVLLTGVHERYLVHGAPFLLLAVTALELPVWARRATWFVMGWAGLFVLASVEFDAFVGPLFVVRHHVFTALLEVALLVGMFAFIAKDARWARQASRVSSLR